MTLSMTPDDVLALLKEGNRRFLSDEPITVQASRMSRLRMAAAQHPIAAYLSCSDSRVAPELLFGRGLGHGLDEVGGNADHDVLCQPQQH